MKEWQFKLNIKPEWDTLNSDEIDVVDNDEDFIMARTTLVAALKREAATARLMHVPFLNIVARLEKAKHLASFNRIWEELYDYCDANRIWLSTLI